MMELPNRRWLSLVYDSSIRSIHIVVCSDRRRVFYCLAKQRLRQWASMMMNWMEDRSRIIIGIDVFVVHLMHMRLFLQYTLAKHHTIPSASDFLFKTNLWLISCFHAFRLDVCFGFRTNMFGSWTICRLCKAAYCVRIVFVVKTPSAITSFIKQFCELSITSQRDKVKGNWTFFFRLSSKPWFELSQCCSAQFHSLVSHLIWMINEWHYLLCWCPK